MNDMGPEDFRRAAHEVVDWMADYLGNMRDYAVMSRVRPGEMTDLLPASAPEKGEPVEDILADFRHLVMPAITHWNHPRFHAFFSNSASAPGILAEMIAATLNVNGMIWKSCPAVTELEQVTLGWLRQWVGLPESWFGIIYDTASVSTMHAIAAAREMADPEARSRGAHPNLTLYTSEHSHSSVEKGAIALGTGMQNVRKVPADAGFRICPAGLSAMIQADIEAGRKPFCVVATVGTTSTSSIDPLADIAKIAEQHGLWLHVDAAYGGTAAIVPEQRHILNGVERAHSIVLNPHKWLFTPFDLSAFYTSRPDILRSALSLVPEYLRTPEDPRAVNYMDYSVSLGRGFRALKLWFVMRYFGRERVIGILRNHMAWIQRIADWIRNDERFELSAPVMLGLVCFRFKGTDDQNRLLLDRINTGGIAFLSHTVLNGRFVLRLSIGNVRVTEDDIDHTWKAVTTAAAEL